MKQLRTQRHSHHSPKAWASLDCLLTSLPITPLLHSSAMMRSNGTLPLTDTRRISPQTTSSSGYHSDLSSATFTNESPQSISEIHPISLEKSSLSSTTTTHSSQHKPIFITTKPTLEKSTEQKSLSRISSFIRKQYERAKSKLISKTHSSTQPSTLTTCTKATSTTPLSHLSEDNYTLSTKQQQQQQPAQAQSTHLPSHSLCNQKSHYHQYYLSSVYKQNSSTQPVYSVYIRPLNKQTTTQQSPNYASIHECYSHQQPSYRYSAIKNTHQYPTLSSSSTRRLATMANFEHHKTNLRRHHYYPVEQLVPTSSYPYRHTNNRSNYVPLSDFFSTQNSAFKPIKPKQFYQRPVSNNLYEQIPPSNDPCDLEVAQYFPQTSHWSNPNYFDIYSTQCTQPKQTYTETLC